VSVWQSAAAFYDAAMFSMLADCFLNLEINSMSTCMNREKKYLDSQIVRIVFLLIALDAAQKLYGLFIDEAGMQLVFRIIVAVFRSSTTVMRFIL
jgi:hypothetical protein